jgi:hypothetical protein
MVDRIHSISEDGELMLSILASFSQEESRSASENSLWHIRRKFEAGELVGVSFIYGYNVHKRELTINKKQADVVRMMFDDCLNGMGSTQIAVKLNDNGIPAQRGGRWNPERVLAILHNEKYIGNALMQKKYTTDHLTKRRVYNRGQRNMYYVKETNPPIISESVFENVQVIIAKRREIFCANNVNGRSYPFTSKIVCGHCGKNFKRRIAHGKPHWQCPTFLGEGAAVCHSKQIPEDVLMMAAAEALNLTEFDETVFTKHIEHIRVPAAGRLTFVFADGNTIDKTWHSRSRADSWTDEMKEKAGMKARKRAGICRNQ